MIHVEANDPPLGLRRNELGLRFLYKLRSNATYAGKLNTLKDSEDQKYEENERATKPTGVNMRNSEWQRKWDNSTSKLYHIKPHIGEWESAHNSSRQYDVKLSRLRIGHTRLTHGYLMTRNNQQPKCGNAACGNQTLTIKHCLQECPKWGDERRKCKIQGDIKTLRSGKDNHIP